MESCNIKIIYIPNKYRYSKNTSIIEHISAHWYDTVLCWPKSHWLNTDIFKNSQYNNARGSLCSALSFENIKKQKANKLIVPDLHKTNVR